MKCQHQRYHPDKVDDNCHGNTEQEQKNDRPGSGQGKIANEYTQGCH